MCCRGQIRVFPCIVRAIQKGSSCSVTTGEMQAVMMKVVQSQQSSSILGIVARILYHCQIGHF